MAVLKTRSDAGKLARHVETARVQIPPETSTTARLLAEGAVFVYRTFAPKRSGRLRRGVRMVATGGAYAVRADAVNPATGYDYVGVTRKGHRKKIIRPLAGRGAASVISTGRARGRGRSAALRIVLPSGAVIYRHSVKGYRPKSDWAERAGVPVRKLAQGSLVRLAQRIERAFR